MGCLGDMEIVFGVTESKNQITTASEWCSAWQKASKAIGFTVPLEKKNMEITSNVNSLLNSSPHITKSYFTTLPSTTELNLPEDNMFDSLTHTDSQDSIQQSFSQTESNKI
jgi:hypothetical protein